MLEFTEDDLQEIIDYNKSINESDWNMNENLFKSCFSSYYYYDDLLEQICAVFRGLNKNHAFSNANKRTAAMLLTSLLNSYGYDISNNDLINISLDVAEHNYEVPEIAEKLSKMIYVI